MPLAKKVPQRAGWVFGSRGGEEQGAAAGEATDALARLSFDIEEFQSVSEMTAISINEGRLAGSLAARPLQLFR